MNDKTLICTHCALFGKHKTHDFESCANFLAELSNHSKEIHNLKIQQVNNASISEEVHNSIIKQIVSV